MARATVNPASGMAGDIVMPGDKSISHRAAMIAGIADGVTTIEGFSSSADSLSTLACLKQLGISFQKQDSSVTIEGHGLAGFRQPEVPLDAQNSGTTVRMLSGLLAACPLKATFVGDESLSRRPMKRVIEPLRKFGATCRAREENFLPLTIEGGPLTAIDYRLPMPSAQVKSAVLLAGLHARGTTRIEEPIQTRNHTELALRLFGAEVKSEGGVLEIQGGQVLQGRSVTIPGDVSSAAFFVAAALGLPHAKIRIAAVGLNPTRTGFVNLLQKMGAKVSIEALTVDRGGEPEGSLIVESSELSGMEVRGHWIGNIIDEIPVLAVLATRTREGIRVRDAAELRNKETDRIAAVVKNLKVLGVHVDEFDDGFFVPGGQTIRGGTVDSFGDHRIAMAFAVAGLLASDAVTIENASCVAVSFPRFFEVLAEVVS